MGLRELVREREILLLLLAIVAFFMAAGVVFRVPGPRSDRHVDESQSRTLQQLGLEDPSLRNAERSTLPGILEDWNHQLLIGH